MENFDYQYCKMGFIYLIAQVGQHYYVDGNTYIRLCKSDLPTPSLYRALLSEIITISWIASHPLAMTGRKTTSFASLRGCKPEAIQLIVNYYPNNIFTIFIVLLLDFEVFCFLSRTVVFYRGRVGGDNFKYQYKINYIFTPFYIYPFQV